MARKAADGSGMIRKRTVVSKGKEYTYWEARYTAGHDPGTGKQKQPSISGKTQKEVSRKLKEITRAIDQHTYVEPCRMPLSEWLDTWLKTYCVNQKPLTIQKYETDVEKHIKPGLGSVQLQHLDPPLIQQFYNDLELSAKTVRNIHGVLHKALDQAVKLGYLFRNPSDLCELPKVQPYEIQPLSSQQIVSYVQQASKDELYNLMVVAIFTGMRKGELIGLTWDCVDFSAGSVTVKQQLQYQKGQWHMVPTKSSKIRKLYPPPVAMDALRRERRQQLAIASENIDVWQNDYNLVFTTPTGSHLALAVVTRHHNDILEAAGLPHIRFHDLRHTFAVISLQAGDDVKTLQSNIGHASASFTLDVYAHALDEMKQRSSSRIQTFYDNAKDAKSKSGNGKLNGKPKIG